MSPEEGEMLPAAAPPMDDDNLLSEILLRLPPQPSSLPRASAVCKRWLGLVSDRGFVRRFRLHHRRNPPLLGLFRRRAGSIHFEPTMEPPNHFPHGSFSSPIDDGDSFRLLGCRHGLVLIFHSSRDEFLVWDPVTGDQHRAAPPPGFDMHRFATPPGIDGTVLRAAGDAHYFRFQVVLVDYTQEQNPRAIVFFYSSETAVWNNLISTPVPGDAMKYASMPAVLVGGSLYWLRTGISSVLLEVDLDRQSLAVTRVPVEMFAKCQYCILMVMRAEGGGLGLLSMSDYTAQLWKRNTNCDGVASLVLRRTFELDKLLPLKEIGHIRLLGYAEENNVVLLQTFAGTYMLQLESLQFNKLVENNDSAFCYPLESVYAAETGADSGHDGADQDMLV